ncbi:hypothetical protein [Tessaracoccus palaemonis]|uniref:Uncharacterized protein n=1 Tax=Tessaracoccus palaemonis TaxID=2829499 RepID=A0ABX8SNM0_9ACTN|nr:hypothetical protein [Tessaracoccus palaemonis]QXT63783.1 hypothetical protein KDB89_04740 [Tessaracoccus palaemonis]
MTDAVTSPQPEPAELRRPSGRSGKFRPRPAPDPVSSDVVLERNVLHSTTRQTDQQTQRQREMVGDLPAWHPMPPDELLTRAPKKS